MWEPECGSRFSGETRSPLKRLPHRASPLKRLPHRASPLKRLPQGAGVFEGLRGQASFSFRNAHVRSLASFAAAAS
ncbi:hypothetical protein ACVWWJ_002075 [Luteibacter sp. HA06]|jgi:hypothetical protein